jgi:hypothetical protein
MFDPNSSCSMFRSTSFVAPAAFSKPQGAGGGPTPILLVETPADMFVHTAARRGGCPLVGRASFIHFSMLYQHLLPGAQRF